MNGIDIWAEACRALEHFDVVLPEDATRQVESLIAPAVLEVLRRGEPATALVVAWKATQHRSRLVDPETWLAVLLAFQGAFAARPPGFPEALREAGLGWSRTVLEVDLRLAGQLFHFGRARLHGDHPDSGAIALLEEAVGLFRTVSDRDIVLGTSARRGSRGMFGIAALLLARHTESPAPLLALAVEHLSASERFGDRTAGHFAYLLEAYLRQHELTDDDAALEEAEAVWQRADGVDRIRGLVAAGAELAQAQARKALGQGDRTGALEALKRAESLLTDALDIEPGGSGVTDAFLRAVRARVRHDLFEHDTDEAGRRRARWLTRGEEDAAASGVAEHLGAATQLGIALDRARRLQRRGAHADALAVLDGLEDLLGRVPHDHPSAVQATGARLDSELFIAIAAGGERRVEELLDDALQLPDDAPLPAAATALAARLLIRSAPDDPTVRGLAQGTVARLTTEVTTTPLSGTARRHVAGHAARLAWILGRGDSDRDALRRVARLFRLAITAHAGPCSPMLLADAGACALMLAKLDIECEGSDEHERLGTLNDAACWLEEALRRADEVTYELNETFEIPLVASRAGEAFSRLHALTRDDHHLGRAIDFLGLARRLGHPWPELSGHLGDALYRRGRRHGSIPDLREALRLKDKDHAEGRTARENRSVAASAALELHKLAGEHGDLQSAAAYALQAVELDPAWPWPSLQLAEITRMAVDVDLLPPDTPGASPLRELVRRGDAEALDRHAAELAAQSPEFAPANLGGQDRSGRAVYVLADPHRLLERTLVLKRLPREAAEAEAETTRAFAEYLTRTNSPSNWLVPEALTVLPHPTMADKSVYVMRRAQGQTLGGLMESGANGDVVRSHVHDAVIFLAAYYAWAHLETDIAKTMAAKRNKRLSDGLFERARRFGVATKLAQNLASGLNAVLSEQPFAVAKKDAHGDNWLVTVEGSLVALDLETRTPVPVLWEVVQLLDDWPFLTVDNAGWNQRLDLARSHLAELDRRGVEVRLEQPVEQRMAWFTIAHAAANLARLGEHSDDWRASSSGLTARRARREHARALLEFLASAAPDQGARTGARSLVEGLSRRR